MVSGLIHSRDTGVLFFFLNITVKEAIIQEV